MECTGFAAHVLASFAHFLHTQSMRRHGWFIRYASTANGHYHNLQGHLGAGFQSQSGAPASDLAPPVWPVSLPDEGRKSLRRVPAVIAEVDFRQDPAGCNGLVQRPFMAPFANSLEAALPL